MPGWLIDLLRDRELVAALGTVIAMGITVPFLGFLSKLLMRRSPPREPVAYEARDLPDHPLLVSARVHLADEEMALLERLERKVDHLDDRAQLVQDRLDLLMRR